MLEREISAGEFKQHCLSLMNEVAEEGIELIITKRGIPICRMLPLKPEQAKKRVGWMKGTIKFLSDITAPTDEEWDVLK